MRLSIHLSLSVAMVDALLTEQVSAEAISVFTTFFCERQPTSIASTASVKSTLFIHHSRL